MEQLISFLFGLMSICGLTSEQYPMYPCTEDELTLATSELCIGQGPNDERDKKWGAIVPEEQFAP